MSTPRTTIGRLGRSLLAALVCIAHATAGQADVVRVGSKNFDESKILAEMFAQLIEERTDLIVERTLGLAGTQICFEALKTGAIDVYPEYTGTGLVTILNLAPDVGPVEALVTVRAEFLAKWNLHWIAPLGFENAYELAVPRDLADREQLRTISDLVRVAPRLTAGVGYEFAERDDGLPGLETRYGLTFGRVRSMQQALKYQAAGAGEIDCLDVYTTDGRLVVHDLVVLEDDRGFFPPYEAAALVRGESLAKYPEMGSTLALLSGTFDEAAMRDLNFRVEAEGEAVEVVARDALASLGLIRSLEPTVDFASRRDGFFTFVWRERGDIGKRLVEHVLLAGLGLLLGVVLAVPLGLFLARHAPIAEPVIRTTGMAQTIPSLALLAFMIPAFGIGALPAVIALWIYSLYPILRNTFTGLRTASPDAVAAAHALGMTARDILIKVRLPLAAPVMMAGIRTAAIITIGTATLAAFIGAGGLGEPIISGLQQNNMVVVLSGAIPAALLALAADALLGRVEHALRTPDAAATGEHA